MTNRRYNQSGAGFTLTETLIIGSLVGVLIVAGTLLIGAERARTRDAIRIADMTRLSAGFALLYSQRGSYSDAAEGCAKVGVSAAKCTLPSTVNGLSEIADPGKHSYIVTRVPDKDDFNVRFTLERGYNNYAAGAHTLSRSGIR